MENKQLILLKVIKSNHENHRLALLANDFKTLVTGKKFNRLTIDLEDGSVIDFTKSMQSYMNDGELAQKGRISTWIEKNGFLADSESVILLFELTINEKEATHSYRFLGNAIPLYEQIAQLRNNK